MDDTLKIPVELRIEQMKLATEIMMANGKPESLTTFMAAWVKVFNVIKKETEP